MIASARFLNRLWRDEGGASAVEYALILAIVGAALGAAALVMNNAIVGQMNQTSTCIDTNGFTC